MAESLENRGKLRELIDKFQFVEMNNWLNQGSYAFIKLQKMISFQFYEMGAYEKNYS